MEMMEGWNNQNLGRERFGAVADFWVLKHHISWDFYDHEIATGGLGNVRNVYSQPRSSAALQPKLMLVQITCNFTRIIMDYLGFMDISLGFLMDFWIFMADLSK